MSAQKRGSGISAVVLAAGMSRRMGTPKQLLRIDGKPILERTLNNVRESAVDEIVLVLGAAADRVEKEISTQGLKIVRNEDYKKGMGTSLNAGLEAVDPQANGALIVLADQPFVRAATLNTLIESHRESFHQKSPAQIVIPTWKGFRGNPVLLDRSVFPELRTVKGDMGCRAIFGKHARNIRKIALDDMGILLDIDSREDLQKHSHGPGAVGLPELESREDIPAGRPELILLGRDEVVQALMKLGRMLQFTVTVIDPFLPLAELPEADRVLHALDFSRLPEAGERHVVMASRGQFDEEAVAEAAQTDLAYVGLLASDRRAWEILESLMAQSVNIDNLNRMRAPAGLKIGAESPEEIALSIMAEIVARRSRPEKTR
jgi:molybdenum cofactor cytidylyltransferase